MSLKPALYLYVAYTPTVILHAYLICIEREYIRFQKEIFVHLFILFTPIKTYYIEIEMQNFHYGLT